ncbi:MAG: MaoC family dehydratase [Bacteroidales bacterium]|jgi:acyl dehydratase|nr:MaoC family dehydratase [Bacteroidales bacterium]
MTKIKVGDTYSLEVNYSQKDVDAFAEITQDKNPIHIDAEYAAKTPFEKPIIHGFLSGAVFSRIFGTIFPGEGTIYMYQDMAFLAPTFVDNTYIAKVEVVEVNEEKHRGVVKCTLEDNQGKILISGTAKLMHKEKF